MRTLSKFDTRCEKCKTVFFDTPEQVFAHMTEHEECDPFYTIGQCMLEAHEAWKSNEDYDEA